MAAHNTSGAGGRWQSAARLLMIALSSVSLVLGAAPVTAAASSGGPVLTFDEPQFLGSRAIVSTETFDEFATPTEYPPSRRRVVIDSVRYRSVDKAPPYWTIEAAGPKSSNGLFRRFSEGFDVTANVAVAFRDGGSVRAVGFRLQPFGFPNRFEVLVTDTDGATTSFLLSADISPVYLGLSSPNRIKQVVITQHPELTGGGTTNFSLDDVSRSTIRR